MKFQDGEKVKITEKTYQKYKKAFPYMERFGTIIHTKTYNGDLVKVKFSKYDYVFQAEGIISIRKKNLDLL